MTPSVSASLPVGLISGPTIAWTKIGVNDPTCFRSGSQLHSQQTALCMTESPCHALSLQGRVSPEMSALESLEKMHFHSPFQAKSILLLRREASEPVIITPRTLGSVKVTFSNT